MKEKWETVKEQATLFWTCTKYDIKSAILAAKIKIMRLHMKRLRDGRGGVSK